jgi:cytochrome c oxidase assembly protein subunit 15
MAILSGGHKVYQKFAIASFASIFILIIVGATVRITGSGMGCPDWPKCFGRYVPPTDVSQLPANYQEIYKDRGYDTMQFNPVKTWIEYINRLWTGLVSFVAIGMMISSFSWWKQDKTFVFLSIGILLLIGFEAWLGAMVVAKKLDNNQVTNHLIASMLILALSIAGIVRAYNYTSESRPPLKSTGILNSVLGISLILLFVQIIMGTFVRTEMDQIAKRIDERKEWISQAVNYLPSHRIMAIVVSLSSIALSYLLLKKENTNRLYRNSAWILLLCLVGQMLTGSLLNSFGFPAAAQLLHLVFAMGMFAAMIFVVAFNVNRLKVSSGNTFKNVHLA